LAISKLKIGREGSVSQQNWQTYVSKTKEDIETTLQELSCQPILFIGSGLSMRYFQAPTWDGLLKHMAELCPEIDKDFAYYKQCHHENPQIAELFVAKFMDWAWSKQGRGLFSQELFSEKTPKSAFFKEQVANYLKSITPTTIESVADARLRNELEALRNIRPHAIITTNYDTFLETIFPDYQPIIGEQILRGRQDSIGEIFKIHGCITQPEGLVITESDYQDYAQKKKYLSAKLLTYFIEHPLVFLGYSANDKNIRGILSDIDVILSGQNKLIDNIYIINWKTPPDLFDELKSEELIPIENNKSVRIKNIASDDFEWIYKAFTPVAPMERVSIKTLRSLVARSQKLFRCDIPRNTVEVDFNILSDREQSDEAFAKVFGVSILSESNSSYLNCPFGPKQVAEKLGLNGPYEVNKLIAIIADEKGIKIKESDNNYHQKVFIGKTPFHKYSEATLDLLDKVKKGLPYQLSI
jgi:SIR2-like domain